MRHLLPLLLIVLPGLVWGGTTQDIVIDQAWIRETPPGVSPMAGYLEISNNSAETIVLQQISSRDFERIELHRTRVEGEVARMERKENLTLSPGQTVELKPGDYHLMLFNPSRVLHTGDRVPLTFSFKDLPALTVEAEIRAHDSGASDHHHH